MLLSRIHVRSCGILIFQAYLISIDPSYKLHQPRRLEVISLHLQDKFYAALATRFEKSKAAIQAIIDFSKPITQYGRVTCLGGGDTIVCHDMVRRSHDSRDASHIKVSWIRSRSVAVNLADIFILVCSNGG